VVDSKKFYYLPLTCFTTSLANDMNDKTPWQKIE